MINIFLLPVTIYDYSMLKLYNTLARKKKEFKPLKNGAVGLYACGPTVYDYAHIGNLRTYIFEDILKRVLIFNGYKIKHVINITDVGHLTSDSDTGEDKMSKALKRAKKPFTLKAMKEIGEFYTNAFKEDFIKLNILSPDTWSVASEHIEQQINLIQRLEKKGYTYSISDGVYFDTSRFKDYGKLASKAQEDDNYSRIENTEKRSSHDFALWKFDNKLGWESPWGKGFPGWHIECSAMSMEHLGETFDIHAGAIDLIPIHHTNEIAQSQAATDKPLANFWIHGNFLQIDKGIKMAKSAGDFLTLEELEKKGYSPMDYRYLTLTANYRSPLLFNFEALDAARNARERLNNIVLDLLWSDDKKQELSKKFREKFTKAVNDDLNIPQALAILWQSIASLDLEDILWADKILGLGLDNIKKEVAPNDIQELVDKREQARMAQNWTKSDTLRDKIAQKGWIVEDTPKGPRIKKA